MVHLLHSTNPTVVVFDRFYCEEAFSFRVKDICPQALRVVDMQDVHFLRTEREALALPSSSRSLADLLSYRPNSQSEAVLRELASIYRSDLTLVCSPVELDMLQSNYNIPPTKLSLAPFFIPSPSPHKHSHETSSSFEQRKDVMMIGNWRHKPNVDAAVWAVEEIWPLVTRKLKVVQQVQGNGGDTMEAISPVKLKIYGAYPTGKAASLHRPKQNVESLGFAPNVSELCLSHRLMLAPLRFGAGLKGKIVDAWYHGLPVVTTPVGAEGMIRMRDGNSKSKNNGGSDGGWGGLYNRESAGEIADAVVELYLNNNKARWLQCQQRGFQLLEELYDRDGNLMIVKDAIEEGLAKMQERRDGDVVGGMLWREQCRSTEFFSRWLELKETSSSSSS